MIHRLSGCRRQQSTVAGCTNCKMYGHRGERHHQVLPRRVRRCDLHRPSALQLQNIKRPCLVWRTFTDNGLRMHNCTAYQCRLSHICRALPPHLICRHAGGDNAMEDGDGARAEGAPQLRPEILGHLSMIQPTMPMHGCRQVEMAASHMPLPSNRSNRLHAPLGRGDGQHAPEGVRQVERRGKGGAQHRQDLQLCACPMCSWCAQWMRNRHACSYSFRPTTFTGGTYLQ